ncbi:MAG: hypothetical protein J5507_02760 [Clostridia bacterium]|nr:hypothetical protein [Clostridia bacterium]
MKKIFLLVLVSIILISGLFILTGCESKKEAEGNNEQPTPVVDETLVEINGLEFHLDKETSFKDVKYTIVGDFKEANFDSYIQYYYYQEDSTNLLFFRIFDYGKKSNDDAIADLGLDSNITFTDGKTDNIEYKYYAEPRDDGGTIHFYFINKDGNLYVLHFVSKYDIKDFEDKVVKSINF